MERFRIWRGINSLSAGAPGSDRHHTHSVPVSPHRHDLPQSVLGQLLCVILILHGVAIVVERIQVMGLEVALHKSEVMFFDGRQETPHQ